MWKKLLYNSPIKYLLVILLFLISAAPVLADPLITITTIPANLTIDQQFELTATASALEPSTNYYIQFRLGVSPDFNDGLTLSSGVWLTDNADWLSMPQITSDSLGIWSGTLTAKAKNTTQAGVNQAFVRLFLNGSYSDSSPASVSATPAPTPKSSSTPTSTPAPTSTPSPTPTPTIIPTKGPTPTPLFYEPPEVLAQTIQRPTAAPAKSLSMNTLGANSDDGSGVTPPGISAPAIVMIILGVIGMGASAFMWVFRRQPQV
jgi:hypothetical protein